MTDETDRLRALWGHVLLVAIRDAIWPMPKRSQAQNAGTTPLDQYRARQWFNSRDFGTVCALAGFEPEFIRDHVAPLFDAPAEKQRAFLVGLGLGGGIAKAEAQRGINRMAGKLAKIAATAALCVILPFAAKAAPQCGERAAITYQLANQYLEAPLLEAIDEAGNLVEWWGNPATGTWTLLSTKPDGPTCATGAGKDFRIVPLEPTGDPA